MTEFKSYEEKHEALTRYYRQHSKFYDATRWSFIFGREGIITWIQEENSNLNHILEVGCGTGRNLGSLARAYPEAHISALDLSEDMLSIARKRLAFAGDRVRTICEPYSSSMHAAESYDLILFSYTLSMFNPGWEEAIEAAANDLSPSGIIAVVDFHASSVPLYRSLMQRNHVRMDAHILPKLKTLFDTRRERICSAYLGVWKYILFIGQRKQSV